MYFEQQPSFVDIQQMAVDLDRVFDVTSGICKGQVGIPDEVKPRHVLAAYRQGHLSGQRAQLEEITRAMNAKPAGNGTIPDDPVDAVERHDGIDA